MADFERMKGALARFVEQVMGRVDYLALYPCRVVSQNADGTLELKPNTDKMGAGLSRVPLRLGLPGVTVKVKNQARVLLGFEAGDPQRPVATLWEADGLDEITVTAQTKAVVNSPNVWLGEEDGDARPVARLGDIVECMFPLAIPGTTPPNATVTVAGAPAPGWLVVTDTLLGIITTAGKKTRAS